MERGGFRFSPGKIFSPIFLSLSLPPSPLFSFLDRFHRSPLFDIGYSVSIFQSFTIRNDFRASLFFSPPFPSSPRPSSPPLPFPPSPAAAFRPTCIGKYESFVPSALSGTCICHGHTQAKPVRTVGNAHACACVRECVRATVCSQVVTKIDRGGLVHGMKKTRERERERKRAGDRGEPPSIPEGGGGGWSKRTRCPAKR